MLKKGVCAHCGCELEEQGDEAEARMEAESRQLFGATGKDNPAMARICDDCFKRNEKFIRANSLAANADSEVSAYIEWRCVECNLVGRMDCINEVDIAVDAMKENHNLSSPNCPSNKFVWSEPRFHYPKE